MLTLNGEYRGLRYELPKQKAVYIRTYPGQFGQQKSILVIDFEEKAFYADYRHDNDSVPESVYNKRKYWIGVPNNVKLRDLRDVMLYCTPHVNALIDTYTERNIEGNWVGNWDEEKERDLIGTVKSAFYRKGYNPSEVI